MNCLGSPKFAVQMSRGWFLFKTDLDLFALIKKIIIRFCKISWHTFNTEIKIKWGIFELI